MRLLYLVLFMAISVSANGQVLTPNNLAIVRVGDGVRNINSTSVSVELMEFTKTGAFTENIIPIRADVNCNRLMLSGTGSYQDGALRLSQDKKYLTLAGYNVPVASSAANTSGSSSVPPISTPKILAKFSLSGKVDMNTLIAMNGSQALRSAVTDNGGKYWISGAASGMIYVPSGNTLSSTPAYTTLSSTNYRSAAFYNGTLYGLGPSNLYSFGTAPAIISTTPTASNTLSGLNPYGFALLDMDPTEPGLDVLYVANQSSHGTSITNGLSKFSKISGNWVANGSLDITNLPSAPSVNAGFLLDLVAEVDDLGNAVIYATRGTGANNALVSITDANGYNVNINSTLPTFKHLSYAGIFHTFKGISFTPDILEDKSTSTLPVKWYSFETALKQNGIELKWSTLSESNNDHFQILRSRNASDFISIGKVKADKNGSSSRQYAYKDENPLLGKNYYKLMQVDANGDKSFSDARVTSWKNSVDELTANDKGNVLTCLFQSLQSADGELTLTDLTGRKLFSNYLKIEKGMNSFIIPHVALTRGIYVLTLSIDGNYNVIKLYVE